MSQPQDLIIEHLKRIQERLGRLESGQVEILSEIRQQKTHQAAFLQGEAIQDGRIAELAARLDRIEKRLDLHDDA
jgi:hypothetical protein|tara:strand:- start:3267 stop:3491 length:225 start_codon:yes stop_codon:yes gene_type:complete